MDSSVLIPLMLLPGWELPAWDLSSIVRDRDMQTSEGTHAMLADRVLWSVRPAQIHGQSLNGSRLAVESVFDGWTWLC
jgi:hypothetical protein